MKKKAPAPPVYYAVAQAQFNPIVAMTEYVPAIQDKLRIKGYTLFEQQKMTQLQVDPNVPGKAEIMEHPIWRFAKSDRTSGFTLGRTHIAFHTTDYQNHAQFFRDFLAGMKEIHAIVKLDHLNRLGLRYLNAVIPFEGENVHQYLYQGLHGVVFSSPLRYSLQESVFDTNIEPVSLPGTIVNRVYCRNGALGFPPDIGMIDLLVAPRFTVTTQHLHAVIDIDHFVLGQMNIDILKVEKALDSLHKSIKDTFKATVTEHALKVWGL